eukprot:2074650-Pyramimonas_sp.AAC.1
MIDQKTRMFETRWSSPSVPQQDSVAVLARVRRRALEAPARLCWTLDTSDQALRLQPDKGRGVDRLVATDVKRLPPVARQCFVDPFNHIEREVAWPHNIMLAVVMLEPKAK